MIKKIKSSVFWAFLLILNKIKKGKLPTSHRYNRLPLLRSHPGGFSGAGCVGLAVANIVNYLLIPRMEILKIGENI